MTLVRKRSSTIRVSDEFYEVVKRISEENGIGVTDATRVIARRIQAKPEKIKWSII